MEKQDSILNPNNNVLIVDDNPQYTIVLKKMLQAAFKFKTIDSIDNPDQALETLTSNPNKYRLLFIDYNFPSGKTGGELLKDLQSRDLLENKVAFLITSDPTMENMKESLQYGAMGVIAKPFDRQAIARQLQKADRAILSQKMEGF